MTVGTFGDYLDTAAAERHDDFDGPVDLDDVARLQRHLEYAGLSRPFPELATFVPPNWTRTPVRTQEEFDAEVMALEGACTDAYYFNLAGVTLSVCGRWVRLVPAGGSVRTKLLKGEGTEMKYNTNHVPDIDYFVVAESQEDYDWFTDASNEHMSQLARDLMGLLVAKDGKPPAVSIRQYVINQGVITMHMPYFKQASVQIILRGPYKTAGAVISGFDLPSCAMYIDKAEEHPTGRVKFTTVGAYAAVTNVQIIDVANRSTTFASRVVKYMARGVGIALPNISTSEVKEKMKANPGGFTIDTIDFCLHILPEEHQTGVEPNMWRCQIEMLDGPQQSNKLSASDYMEMSEPVEVDMLKENTSLFRTLPKLLRVLGRPDSISAKYRFNAFGGVKEMRHPNVIPSKVGDIIQRIDDGLREMYGPDFGIRVLLYDQAHTVRPGLLINKIQYSFTMKDSLGMSSSELEEVQQKVADAWKLRKSTDRYVDFTKLITPYLERAMSCLMSHSEDVVNMWVRFDPQRQWWTASINPAVVDPADFYTQMYRETDRSVPAIAASVEPTPSARKEIPPVFQRTIALTTLVVTE